MAKLLAKWIVKAMRREKKDADMTQAEAAQTGNLHLNDGDLADIYPAEARGLSGDIGEFGDDPDSALMLEVSKGSEDAFRVLVCKWQNPLMNYFYRSVSDSHTAEDLAQQTFINLYRARASYSAKAKFSTYIFFIARRVLINEYRRRQRKPSEATDPFEMEAPAPKDSETELGELEEAFYSALEEMPENQRTAILLLKQQELSYEEIAKAMEASVAAVKTWIHRARQTLRKVLKDRL